jgi:hypothetical protein
MQSQITASLEYIKLNTKFTGKLATSASGTPQYEPEGSAKVMCQHFSGQILRRFQSALIFNRRHVVVS